jgi:hypothetical protein
MQHFKRDFQEQMADQSVPKAAENCPSDVSAASVLEQAGGPQRPS